MPATLTRIPHSFAHSFDHIPPCPGKDNYAHRLFLTTNENGQTESLKELASTRSSAQTIVGVSGCFVLNAAACTGEKSALSRIENIVLIDCSLRVEHFWQEMRSIIISSTNRADCIIKIRDLLEREQERYYSGGGSEDYSVQNSYLSDLASFRAEIISGNSWLSSTKRFMHIQSIFAADRFVFKRLNLCDPIAQTMLADTLTRSGNTIHSLYLSNTWEYIRSIDQKDGFYASIRALSRDDPLIIHTKRRLCISCEELHQVTARVAALSVHTLFQHCPVNFCSAHIPVPFQTAKIFARAMP